MATKTALGKGLDALIPIEGSGVLEIRVDEIAPNPRQPRTQFPESALQALAASIEEHGVLQPILVEATEHGYQLLAGERRLLAAGIAGLETIPAVVLEVEEQDGLEIALVENLQRADLNPLDTAEGYRQLAEDFGMAHEEIAKRVGKSRSQISNTLRLLKLSAPARQALRDGQISEGHARALLALPSAGEQAAALETVVRQGLNVRQTEELVRPKPRQVVSTPPPTPEHSDLQAQLESALGTRVDLRRNKRGGQIVLHYYSDEELNALTDRILGQV